MFKSYAVVPGTKTQHIENYDTVESAIQGTLEFWHEEESPFRLCYVTVEDPEEGETVVATLFSTTHPELVEVTSVGGVHRRFEVRYNLDDNDQYESTSITEIQ